MISLSMPKVVTWMYSGKCNMNCGFCYGLFNEDKLSLVQKRKIIDKIADAKIPKLTLTGGEPLMGEGIYEIIEHANRRGIFVSLHTNGLLLDDSALDFLKGKVGRISLALEGVTNETNYLMRGRKNYFNLVKNLIQKIRKRKIPFSIKTVATKKNIKDILKIAKFLEKYSPDTWLISEFSPERRGRKNKGDFELKEGEFDKLKSQLKSIPFDISLRSLERKNAHPFLFIDSSGETYLDLNDGGNEVKFGSILNNEISELWKNILKVKKVTKDYFEVAQTVLKN